MLLFLGSFLDLIGRSSIPPKPNLRYDRPKIAFPPTIEIRSKGSSLLTGSSSYFLGPSDWLCEAALSGQARDRGGFLFSFVPCFWGAPRRVVSRRFYMDVPWSAAVDQIQGGSSKNVGQNSNTRLVMIQ